MAAAMLATAQKECAAQPTRNLAGGNDDGGAELHDFAREGGAGQEHGGLLALQRGGNDLRHHLTRRHLEPLAHADDGHIRRQHIL